MRRNCLPHFYIAQAAIRSGIPNSSDGPVEIGSEGQIGVSANRVPKRDAGVETVSGLKGENCFFETLPRNDL